MKLLREILFPLIAVIAAFVVGGIVVFLIKDDPIQTYKLLIGSAFSWPDGIGYTLFLATPLIFTGLAVAVAFRCGLLNIGAEGQLYVAAFAAAWVGIKFGGVAVAAPGAAPINTPYANLPMLILVPLCCIAAVGAGALWGGIPGLLKAKFGSHEVINTIMLNFIAVALVSYFTQYHYKIPGVFFFKQKTAYEIKLSNLDKVLFPGPGFTKRDLIRYYVTVAPIMLPY